MCLMKANISGLILNKSADHNETNFRIPKLLFLQQHCLERAAAAGRTRVRSRQSQSTRAMFGSLAIDFENVWS